MAKQRKLFEFVYLDHTACAPCSAQQGAPRTLPCGGGGGLSSRQKRRMGVDRPDPGGGRRVGADVVGSEQRCQPVATKMRRVTLCTI